MNYKELEKYIKVLFGKYFFRYNLMKEDVEDIIQDSMIKILFKEREGVLTNSIEENKNYIFILVRNEMFKFHKKKNKYSFSEIDTDLIPNDNTNILDLIDLKLKVDIITHLTSKSRFSDRERLVIEYNRLGYSNREIAELTNSTINKVKNSYSSLQVKLKDELQPTYRYKLTHNDGREMFFVRQYHLLNYTSISLNQFQIIKKTKKTKFKNYTIEIL